MTVRHFLLSVFAPFTFALILAGCGPTSHPKNPGKTKTETEVNDESSTSSDDTSASTSTISEATHPHMVVYRSRDNTCWERQPSTNMSIKPRPVHCFPGAMKQPMTEKDGKCYFTMAAYCPGEASECKEPKPQPMACP